MGRVLNYEARGVEVLGNENNWVRVAWGEAEVLVAERESKDQILILRLGDDVELAVDEMVAQVVDRRGDIGRATERLEEFLRDVDADELLLIDPGRKSKCDPVLITRERRRLVVWQRVEDRRIRSGWRWNRATSCYDDQVPTIFFDGESGVVTISSNKRKIA